MPHVKKKMFRRGAFPRTRGNAGASAAFSKKTKADDRAAAAFGRPEP
jgi:hypothetical protein